MKNTWYSLALVLGLLLTGCGLLRSTPEDSDNEVLSKAEEVNLGYGTQPRSKMTHSVASISKSDIERYRAQSMQELLVRLPGFSKRYSLIMLDGVQVHRHDLAGINPSEVTSISLLKDAGSVAIYGFQGGMGPVLVITTERGQFN